MSSGVRPSPRSSRVSDDTGAATVLAAVLIAVLTTIVVAGIWLASAVIARHRAQAAADLAALVGAARMPAGEARACSEAEALARLMGAAMRQCAVSRLDVTVVVSVAAGGPMGTEATASARAGPTTGSAAA